MGEKLMLCDCLGSQSLDGKALAAASGMECPRIHSALCMHESDAAAKAIREGGVVIACQQERAFFEALAEEMETESPLFVDIRDRAGWSDDENDKTAKMAALIAEARMAVPPVKTVDVVSSGACLIVGDGETALTAARDLCEMLAVTVLLAEECELPADRRFDIVCGRLKSATGALGNFSVTIDGFRQVVPGGRGAPVLGEARDGAQSQCDIILDLSGGTPLFAAGHRRDGYLRADPGSHEQRHAAILEASQLVGTFEKPLHIRLEPSLCAHSRAGQVGCSKCLDHCATGAISPDGDHVRVDAAICAGCGACSAVCPSQAIALDAPPVATVFARMETLATAYRALSQEGAPRLLVHDGEEGAEMIRLAARFGSGLPADVIPLEVAAIAAFGHAEMLAGLACGFSHVSVLYSPQTEREVPESEMALAEAIAGKGRTSAIDVRDPQAMCDLLHAQEKQDAAGEPMLAMGTRRQIARLAAKALHGGEEMVLELPENAPYGAIVVDRNACTLCLSCVSLCPSGALGDNPDLPQLRFQEDACLQCGLCRTICPESAITLEPRLNLGDDALAQQVLHEEEPFACVECGALFGVRSTVERIMEKLAGKHAMFASSEASRMIQMCDNCRIQAQYHSQNNPFAGGERPRVRTSADYPSSKPPGRRDH